MPAVATWRIFPSDVDEPGFEEVAKACMRANMNIHFVGVRRVVFGDLNAATGPMLTGIHDHANTFNAKALAVRDELNGRVRDVMPELLKYEGYTDAQAGNRIGLGGAGAVNLQVELQAVIA